MPLIDISSHLKESIHTLIAGLIAAFTNGSSSLAMSFRHLYLLTQHESWLYHIGSFPIPFGDYCRYWSGMRKFMQTAPAHTASTARWYMLGGGAGNPILSGRSYSYWLAMNMWEWISKNALHRWVYVWNVRQKVLCWTMAYTQDIGLLVDICYGNCGILPRGDRKW